MSYARGLIDTPFDYGALRTSYPALADLNPRGTCFNLSCLWVSALLKDSNQSGSVLKSLMCNNIAVLALRHRSFIRAVDAPNITSAERTRAWREAISKYGLTSDGLAPGMYPIGASRVPDSPSVTDRSNFAAAYNDPPFNALQLGDMWGVVWEFLKMQATPYACIFNYYHGPDRGALSGGHAIGVFVPGGPGQNPAGNVMRVRIFDMNAGEFNILDLTDWRTWSNALDVFDTDGGPINFLDVMDLRGV